MCTHAQNGFADNPKQTARALFHEPYFIDTDETRFLADLFYSRISPQIHLHTAQKIEAMCRIPQHPGTSVHPYARQVKPVHECVLLVFWTDVWSILSVFDFLGI
jgi:hypothetical protein